MSFHKILERLREASKGQRGMKDSCSVSKYDLSELLCDFDRLDYQARLLVPKLESIEKECDEALAENKELKEKLFSMTSSAREYKQLWTEAGEERNQLREKLAAMESQKPYKYLSPNGELRENCEAKNSDEWGAKFEPLYTKPVPADKPAVAVSLSAEEERFLIEVLKNPGSKLSGCATHWIADGSEHGKSVALWKKPESMSLIKCVGSYKWIPTKRISLGLIIDSAPSHSQQSAYKAHEWDGKGICKKCGVTIFGRRDACPSHESEQS